MLVIEEHDFPLHMILATGKGKHSVYPTRQITERFYALRRFVSAAAAPRRAGRPPRNSVSRGGEPPH